ncbi:MAG TPA: hypothetical protein PK821_05425, partial [Victivallales bacterium]|nr:hypothetical protein [Victivallales bacterium]
MPIISQIGRKDIKVKILVGIIYTLLSVGAFTMVYPLSLMLAGSLKSDADAWSIKPYPEFWFKDTVLFRKYVEAKYNVVTTNAQYSWERPIISWRTLERPEDIVQQNLIDDFRQWRSSIPVEKRIIGSMNAASGKVVFAKN